MARNKQLSSNASATLMSALMWGLGAWLPRCWRLTFKAQRQERRRTRRREEEKKLWS